MPESPTHESPAAGSIRSDETDLAATHHSLRGKFGCALYGVKWAVRLESNFFVHFFIAAAVIATAAIVQVDLWEWCVLIACIAAVLSTEMFNTAIEQLAKVVTQQHHPIVGRAPDISSAGVLIAAMGSTLIGVLILGRRLMELVGSG